MTSTGGNLPALRRVAERLGPLRERVVFLGGAVTELLVTDPGSAPPRPTLDVDVIVDVTTRSAYAEICREMRALGFSEDTETGAPMCRWIVAGTRVDLMPTDDHLLGFTNRWYPAAVAAAVRHDLPEGPTIRLISAPCFIATKFEAFRGRGNGDFRASHDLEDLLTVVDGRPTLEAEVLVAERSVRDHIAVESRRLLADARFIEALPGHLPGDPASQARLPLILATLGRLSRH